MERAGSYKITCISEEYALEYLINLVRATINKDNYNALTNTEDRISYLRALAINTLINETVALFMTHEEAILNGEFSKALLDVSKYQAQIKDIIKLSIEKVYQSKEVIDKEIAGFRIINDILSVFTDAIYKQNKGELSSYNQLILKGLPKSFHQNQSSLYESLLAISNYIAKLSDSNAMLTYKKLSGNLL